MSNRNAALRSRMNSLKNLPTWAFVSLRILGWVVLLTVAAGALMTLAFRGDWRAVSPVDLVVDGNALKGVLQTHDEVLIKLYGRDVTAVWTSRVSEGGLEGKTGGMINPEEDHAIWYSGPSYIQLRSGKIIASGGVLLRYHVKERTVEVFPF